jgi:hypothetical protein
MASIDSFVLRRLQMTAMNRWQAQPKQADDNVVQSGTGTVTATEHLVEEDTNTSSTSSAQFLKEEKSHEKAVVDPKPARSTTTITTRGRPPIGPRNWKQRRVFHDVLDCSLLDDDDEDFFGTKKNTKGTAAAKSVCTNRRTARSLSPAPPTRNKVMSLAA